MTPTQEIANHITAILPNVKRGTLRFWGQWFGKPYDNYHWLVACDATEDCRLRFNEDEVLAIWDPADAEITETTFRIGSATSIRWTWYYYGRPKTPENLFYIDYAQQDGGIVFRTNWDTILGAGPLGEDAITYPAAEMPDGH